MILTYLFIILAVGCYAVSQSVIQGKFNLYGGNFWSNNGHRKYKWLLNRKDPLGYTLIDRPQDAPDTLYYRFFNIKYKERFPLSATLLVFVTDAYHLFQFLFKIFLCLAFVPHIGWIWSAGLWATFGIVFTLVYKYSQK